MRPNDKKKLAMIIVGSKPDSDESYKSEKEQEDKEEDLEQEAMKITMKKFMKAIKDEDEESACKLFKELTQFNSSEDTEEDDY